MYVYLTSLVYSAFHFFAVLLWPCLFPALAHLHRSSCADGKFSIRWQGTDDLSRSIRLPQPRCAVHFSSSASPVGDIICLWFSLSLYFSSLLAVWLISSSICCNYFLNLNCLSIFFLILGRMDYWFFADRQALLLFTFINLRWSPRPSVRGGNRWWSFWADILRQNSSPIAELFMANVRTGDSFLYHN